MSQNNVGRMALESLRRKGFQWSLDSLSMGLELTSGNPAKGHTLNISEDSVNIRRFGELMSNHFHNRARKIIGSSPFLRRLVKDETFENWFLDYHCRKQETIIPARTTLFLDFLKDLSRDYKRYRVNGCADPIRVLSIACRQSRQRGEQFLRKDDGDVIETLAELGLINLIEGNRYQLPLEELMDMLCAIDAISVLLTDDLLPVDLKEEVPTAAVRRAAIPCGAERTVSFCLALLSGSPLQEPYASRLSCSYALDRHAPRHDCRAIRLMLDDPSFTCSFVTYGRVKIPNDFHITPRWDEAYHRAKNSDTIFPNLIEELALQAFVSKRYSGALSCYGYLERLSAMNPYMRIFQAVAQLKSVKEKARSLFVKILENDTSGVFTHAASLGLRQCGLG